jgi:hypothetical protein
MQAHDCIGGFAVRNAMNQSTFLGPRGTRFLLKKVEKGVKMVFFGPVKHSKLLLKVTQNYD